MNFRSKDRRKILLVAMANSIHVARWLELMVDMDVEVRLISSNPSTSIHPKIEALIKNGPNDHGMRLNVPSVSRYFSMYMWIADRVLDDWIRGMLIFWQILIFKPEIVHVLELQNAGYPTLKAFGLIPKTKRPKLFITNYGSDVYWYQNLQEHLGRLKSLMKIADAFSAECLRDVQIAKGLGFKNVVLETVPVTGGMDIKTLPKLDDGNQLGTRKSIALKGYQGQWGRAVEAVSALATVPGHLLEEYTLEIYSCEAEVEVAAETLRAAGMKVICHPKGSLNHEQVLEIFRRSRLYIGLSASDGISTSMLEAMSQGAVPIQTDTSCANEWLSGKNQGYIASLATPANTAAAIVNILTNDDFVKQAQAINIQVIRARYDKLKIKKVVENYYADVFKLSPAGKRVSDVN